MSNVIGGAIIGGMVNPNDAMEKVPAYTTWQPNRALATSYLMTGPTSGSNGVPSTNFTVTLPANVALPMHVIITPADSGTGTAGTFSPTTCFINDINQSATFKYTPGSTGAKVISVTNDSGLTNPASITYTSS